MHGTKHEGWGMGTPQLVPHLEALKGGMSIHAHTQLIVRLLANSHPA